MTWKESPKRNLLSPLGIVLRKRRSVEVESVFGQIKRNFEFKRFHLRGKENATVDFGLVAIAHNLSKLHFATP